MNGMSAFSILFFAFILTALFKGAGLLTVAVIILVVALIRVAFRTMRGDKG